MNFRVFVRTLFFVVIIASAAFVIYSNVAVSDGKAGVDTYVGQTAGENTSVMANSAQQLENNEIFAAAQTQSADNSKSRAEQDGSSNRSYVKEAAVIKISALGDVALGQDHRFNNTDSFDYVFDKNKGDYNYFFSNVAGILSEDDLTIANLETTLSNETTKAEKFDIASNNYWFNGNPLYANILKAGSVEVANLANNHTYDYGQKGYDATRNALKAVGIDYFGYSDVLIREVKGIKVGMIGFNQLGNVEQGLDMNVFKKEVADMTSKLRGECDLLIANFHWGKEYQYQYNAVQKELAMLVIDSGADLVIGNHPHVLEPIETYKGKYIAYSLGNFCFGGVKKPDDYDTAIYQQSFVFDSDKILQPVKEPTIIPCSVSSAKGFNNYQPVVATEPQISSVLKKLKLSPAAAGATSTTSAGKVDKKSMVKLDETVKDIVIDLRYASSNNITGKPVYESNTAYLRKGTADKLDKANQLLLKQGYRIKVWDAYRAQKYQLFLYNNAPNKSVFLDPKTGYSNHTRGAAVDCTLVTPDGKKVDMPSDFDDGTALAYRDYEKCTKEQKQNALILENVMKSCGFSPISNEWWHFDDSECKSYDVLAAYP